MLKTKVLFICLGNVCRSPLAAAVMQDYIEKNSRAHLFEIDSAGTSAYHLNYPPDPRSVMVATKHGIKLEHTARQINKPDLDYYDYFLVMDHRNYEDVSLLMHDKNALKRVFLLRSFDEDRSSYNVPDPFYGPDSDFEEVFVMCQKSVQGFIRFLHTN